MASVNQDAINKALNQQLKDAVAAMKEMAKSIDSIDARLSKLEKQGDSSGKGSSSDAMEKLAKQLEITDDRGLRTHVALGNLVKRVMELEKQAKAAK